MKLFPLGLGLVLFVVTGCFPKDKCTTEDGGVVDGSCLDTASDTSGEIGDSDDITVTETDTSGDTGDADSDSVTDTSGDTGDSVTDTGSVDGDIDGYNSDVDCDDHNEAVHPDATEVCNGIDDNCDGVIDEGVESTWYADGDSDGYGSVATSVEACVAPTGYVADATDCDDANPAVHPNVIESCIDAVDLNCDGSSGVADADGDGTIACEDCSDTEAAMYPGGTETCDGLDNDCDAIVDNDATDALAFYADVDEDSFGDPLNTQAACTASAGYVSDATDCDDTRSDINPSEDEQCDGSIIDENCNGLADDADPTVLESGKSHLFHDADGDAYGDPATDTLYCASPDGSWIGESTDCNDGNAGINPSAIEACNDVDDDCDGGIDEAGASGESVWYADADDDGYGDPDSSVGACSVPAGYVADSSDCDDTNSGSYPGGADIAGDGVDSNCDGMDGVVPDRDSDGDPDSTDCDDANAAIYTGAPETCDSVDNDCDGSVDEGVSTAYFEDVDGDGYGDSTSSMEDCTLPPGYVLDYTDCDDTRDWAYPGGSEVCWQAVDADCDGVSGECWGGLTGPNLFEEMWLWNMEEPIGTGNVTGIVAVGDSAAATSDCTTPAMTDICSAMLQGPGSWTIESNLSANAGDDMFCFVSLLGSDSSVPTTVEVYRGATSLISVSHEAFSGAWTPTSEMVAVVPASAGTIVIEITIPGSDAAWLDAVVCQQVP